VARQSLVADAQLAQALLPQGVLLRYVRDRRHWAAGPVPTGDGRDRRSPGAVGGVLEPGMVAGQMPAVREHAGTRLLVEQGQCHRGRTSGSGFSCIVALMTQIF